LWNFAGGGLSRFVRAACRMPALNRFFPRRTRVWLALLLLSLGGGLIGGRAETWDEILQRGALRWGDDAEGGAPYIYHPPDRPTELVGFEVEFAAALAGRLGLKSEFVQNNWDMLVPALNEGSHFDVIIAGLERTPENLAKLAMSRPYFVYAQQLVIPAGTTNVTRLADLRGKRVGVLSATASHRLAEGFGGLEVKVYQDNVNYFSDLELGRLDAVLTDTPIAQVNLADRPKLKAAGPPFAPGFYAVGVRREDPELLAKVNAAIATLAGDGTLERIYRRYSLWAEEQNALRDWQDDERAVARERRSALREWRTYLPMLLRASVTTIWVTCAGMVLAATWGLGLALLRLYGPAPARWLAIAYIEIFRGTPLLLQIYFIYFGLAQQLGLRLSAGAAAVLALGLNYAANEAENYRAGIQAVPRGQTEAALALGLTRRLTLRRVILPQALRISLPSVTNDFIAMFKDSSIVSVIALVELTKEYQIRAIDTGDYVGLGLMTAAIYFGISYTASLGARAIERRLNRDSR
jgi:polar amino acid transport system substrate-binding protein